MISKRGEVLVAFLPRPGDLEILRRDGWYRIPEGKEPRRWPPEYVAFYQPKAFGMEAFAVRYWAKVSRIESKTRREIFPDEPSNAKSGKRYYQIFIEKLETLPEPIPNFRKRFFVFIPTTLYKLETAQEINDLYDESPLEEAVWIELKKLGIPAERQFYVDHAGQRYALDFAVFCRDGRIDIETDGDVWHSKPERIEEDNRRNNAMATLGYKVLRFNTLQVCEQMAEYCVPQIVKTVNRLGGAEEDARDYLVTKSGEIAEQLRLFEERGEYEAEGEW